MKSVQKITWVCAGMAAVVLSLHLLGYEAFAAEKTSSWRPTYDLIMRWVNFGIIVFLLNKYAKTPAMNFLRGQKEKLAKEIKALEDKKEDATANITETQKAVDESEDRFADLKKRIVKQGEKKKQEIIESSHKQSQLMLEDANRRIDSYLLGAKNTLKAELVDMAIDLATQRLPQEITEADGDKFIEQYMASSSAE